MSEGLSQEQIDNMIKDGNEEIEPLFNQDITDLIGEVGNISMSQAATTLSSILNRRVTITTPRVKYVKFKEILSDLVTPKVSSVVGFKEGLEGSNLMLLNVEDAIIIADLMIGGDGHPESNEFTELELSAVGEAMNQMIGSASTSMATMIGKKVDILPPEVNLWKDEESVSYTGIDLETVVSKVSFDLSVEGVIESEIMQIYTREMVEEISELMMQDTAEVLKGREVVKEKIVEETIQTQENTRKVVIQQPEFEDLDIKKVETNVDNLDLLMDVPLDFSVVLGNSRKSIKEILSIGVGSVVELDKLTDEPLEVYVNGKLLAHGEVVVINENFGIRITSILSQKQRINNLN